MGICWGDPRFPTPSHTGSLNSGMKLTISSSSSSEQSAGPNSNEPFPDGMIFLETNLRNFTLAELKAATGNFGSDSLLGEGGFGQVFKGLLDEKAPLGRRKTVIAVKKLNEESFHGYKEWKSEIEFLGRLYHPNLATLLGYCHENSKMLLVYDFAPKGSLNNHLFGRGSVVHPLPWSLRLKIAIGAARGLAFLHSFERAIIYRDLKTSNILLDASHVAKLSDFGLARLGPKDGETHVSTRIMGTYGYAAPEYVATGHLYIESDVYSYGVVLLELLTGLKAVDRDRPKDKHKLVEWAKPRLQHERKVVSMMDPKLGGKYPPGAALEIGKLALRCLKNGPKLRPSMAEVVKSMEEIEAGAKGTRDP
ncbi:probable serine/threonine-protein kinase PIX13 isoform X1 [Punica granatum]|uniref:Uncharacterized protein n=2 Tax=Punica granatum TaxID=22663 RepID=A0A2I0IM70_PUNGR|nr:probable serine/threonine-protein kinase PIX13 isoform X1 [Punica granatum]PKI44823.1 hypothetical protein CRG98_034771 [Punica granatum]